MMVPGLLARENQRPASSQMSSHATFRMPHSHSSSTHSHHSPAGRQQHVEKWRAWHLAPSLCCPSSHSPFQRTFLYDTSLHGHNHAHIRTVPCRPPRLHGAREEGVGSCHPGLRRRTSSSSSSSSSSPSNPAPVWPNPPPVPSTHTTRGSSKPWSTTPLLHTTVGRALVRGGCAGTEGVRADGGKGRERQDMCRCRQAL